jgi:hypothetical protein
MRPKLTARAEKSLLLRHDPAPREMTLRIEPAATGLRPARYQRQHAAVNYLTRHYHEAPVWIVACLDDGENQDRTAGSSIYPAVQD